MQTEITAAELHGHLCGRLVGGHMIIGQSGERMVRDLLNLAPADVGAAIPLCLELMEESERQFEGNLFEFQMLLPDDESALPMRIESLSDWCNGMLEGLGHTLAAGEMEQSAEAREIFHDLAEVGNISLEVEESEENEAYYTELYEYVRVAAMNLYTLFRNDALKEAEKDAERH